MFFFQPASHTYPGFGCDRAFWFVGWLVGWFSLIESTIRITYNPFKWHRKFNLFRCLEIEICALRKAGVLNFFIIITLTLHHRRRTFPQWWSRARPSAGCLQQSYSLGSYPGGLQFSLYTLTYSAQAMFTIKWQDNKTTKLKGNNLTCSCGRGRCCR